MCRKEVEAMRAY